MNKIQVLLSIVFAYSLFACSGEKATDGEQPYLVVLSLDGFRWDYTNMVETPNFDKIEAEGVKAESLQPSFPSKTFPNHYTIATGLYPGNHGLVNNSFYDKTKDVTYAIRNRETVEDSDFYGGEPIWNTAEKQGVKAATFFWVGSEAPVQNMRPSFWKKYDGRVPWKARVDTVMHWLTLPQEQRPHLVMWYIDEPDHVGHKHSPESDKVKETVQKLDELLGYFFAELEKLPQKDKINFIVTTDHGMGKITGERSVQLSDYIREDQLERTVHGDPVMFLYPKKGQEQAVYDTLKTVQHISVTKAGERPAHWHYNTNPRIGELVVVADSSYSVTWEGRADNYLGGTHGYDPRNKDMHGIFYAIGPAFKVNYSQPSFQNVDVYSLMAKILKLKPAQTDGKFYRVQEMLK